MEALPFLWAAQAALVLMATVGVNVLSARVRRAAGADGRSWPVWLTWLVRWFSLVGLGALFFALNVHSRFASAIALLFSVALLIGADAAFLAAHVRACRSAADALDSTDGPLSASEDVGAASDDAAAPPSDSPPALDGLLSAPSEA